MAKESAPDPAIGVWKLDIDESSFALAPAPKASVMNIEAWESGLKVSADTIDHQGNRIHLEAAYKFDSKDYPLTGSPVADTISATRTNDSKTEYIWRKQGTVAMVTKVIVSLDGKSLRVIRTGIGVLGCMADELLMYDRQ
jgi:hypothetical protein